MSGADALRDKAIKRYLDFLEKQQRNFQHELTNEARALKKYIRDHFKVSVNTDEYPIRIGDCLIRWGWDYVPEIGRACSRCGEYYWISAHSIIIIGEFLWKNSDDIICEYCQNVPYDDRGPIGTWLQEDETKVPHWVPASTIVRVAAYSDGDIGIETNDNYYLVKKQDVPRVLQELSIPFPPRSSANPNDRAQEGV